MAPIRHVLTILAVRDLARAVRFYREAFDWPAAITTGVYVELAITGGMRLGLYERQGFARNTGRLPNAIQDDQLTGTELYLYTDDIDGAIRRLHAAGARELGALAPRDWGEDVAYFADPEGNVIAIARQSELVTD